MTGTFAKKQRSRDGDAHYHAMWQEIGAKFAAILTGVHIAPWDAENNSLSNATVDPNGSWYSVSVGGTVDFGDGPITFTTSDAVYSNGVTYEKRKLPNSRVAS